MGLSNDITQHIAGNMLTNEHYAMPNTFTLLKVSIFLYSHMSLSDDVPSLL